MNYKYVDLFNLNSIQKQVLATIPESLVHSTTVAARPPELFEHITGLVETVEQFSKWTDLYNICIGVTTPFGHQEIHVDGVTYYQGQTPCNKWALNIPILNCDETYTCWYKPINESIAPQTFSHAGSQVFVYAAEHMIECERAYWTKPLWFNTSVPHRGFNPTSHNRLMISIRFKNIFDPLS